eukprot:m51a1_g398 hypothetical protein (327) ;mRNA; f:711253-712607
MHCSAMDSSWAEIQHDGALVSGSTFAVRLRLSFEWLSRHSSDLSIAGSFATAEDEDLADTQLFCSCGEHILLASPASKTCVVQPSGIVMTLEPARLHFCAAPDGSRADASADGATMRLWVLQAGIRVSVADVLLALPTKALLREALRAPFSSLAASSGSATAPSTPLVAQFSGTRACSAPVTPPSTPSSLLAAEGDGALVSVVLTHSHLARILSKMPDVTLLDARTHGALALPAAKRRRGRPLGKMADEARRLKNERARATRIRKEALRAAQESAAAAQGAAAAAAAAESAVQMEVLAEEPLGGAEGGEDSDHEWFAQYGMGAGDL